MTKECTTCHKERNLDDFRHNGNMCKLCKTYINRNYLNENRESLKVKRVARYNLQKSERDAMRAANNLPKAVSKREVSSYDNSSQEEWVESGFTLGDPADIIVKDVSGRVPKYNLVTVIIDHRFSLIDYKKNIFWLSEISADSKNISVEQIATNLLKVAI